MSDAVVGPKTTKVSIGKLLTRLEPFKELPREEARKAILQVAAEYRERRAESQQTPRASTVRKRLRGIADAAKRLRLLLESADPFTFSAMQRIGWRFTLDATLDQLVELRRTSGEPSEVIARMRALEKLAVMTAELVPADRGGGRGSDMHSSLFGSPKWHLAGEALYIFISCRPPKVAMRGTRRGALHLFAEDLLEYASNGAEPAGESMYEPLLDWIRRERRKKTAAR